MKRAEKKRKQKKVMLMFTLATAAVIVGGMTFAWFSSKDQVTNRLSAAGNYGTSIVEDFQPPQDWIPGQEVNKDVAVVNTGNVDAFVRVNFDGQMRILREVTPTTSAVTTTSPISASDAVTDEKLTALNLTYGTASGGYYKELSTSTIKNPDLNDSGTDDEETNQPAQFSEVQSVQAGGVLVYAPTGAKYSWTLEQSTTFKNKAGNVVDIAKDAKVGTEGATGVSGDNILPDNYYGAIDASTFKPESTGLYIFRRNVKETSDGTANLYEYSGYFYDATLQKYLALHYATGANENSDYVLPAGSVTDNSTATPSKDQVLPVTPTDAVKFYIAKESVINTGTADTDLKWVYDATNNKFAVTYLGADNTSESKDDDNVVIDIQLANVGTTDDQWAPIGANTHAKTFYYTNDLEGGDTTTKLVDYLKLSDDTKKDAYLAFDFDLNVYMQSVQVTKTQDGKESTRTVEAATGGAAQFAAAPATNTDGITGTGATATAQNVEEISSIAWTDVNP